MSTREKSHRETGARAFVKVLLIAGALAGCTPDDSDSPATRGVALAPPAADHWLGRWTGPEGTYLDIAGSEGVYELTIRDLDRARTFAGAAVDDRIEFQRDGTLELLTATNGDETGMKWLAGKVDCLTVKRGEGYCRD